MSKLIQFHNADINYQIKEIKNLRKWLIYIVNTKNKSIESINYIFCSDSYLHEINIKYLSHDTYTDIITFPYHEEGDEIQSDIFISIDRAKENSKKYNHSLRNEIHRLLVHGILHLIGYDDHSPNEKHQMTKAEDKYLSLRSNFNL